jgi:hypothetical protein
VNPAMANAKEQSARDWLKFKNPENKISIGKNMRRREAILISSIEKIREDEAPIFKERKTGIEVKIMLDASGKRRMPKIRCFGFG